MRSTRAFFAALSLAALPVAATTYVPVPDPVLADQAAVIAEIRVTAVAEASASGAPATDYQVTVERLLQGRVPGGSLTVRVPGGRRADGTGLKVWGAPSFRPGGRALVFLAPSPDGSFHVLHLMLGAFHEVHAGGRRLAVRDLSEAHAAGGDKARAGAPRDLEKFSQWLADRAGGRRREADYFAPGTDPLPAFEKFDLMDHVGTKIRWFDFDGGGSIAWSAHHAGQPGVAGGGFGEFQRGLAVWNAEPSTPVRYAYAGETDATGGLSKFDGINAILFGQPLADPFDCTQGGVLAIGGPWFSTKSGPWQGADALRILGADIVTNTGIECYFAASANPNKAAEELFGHELGHTLGIGHSCTGSGCSARPEQDDALMRAWLHNDGRGARLSADDRAALQALYLPAVQGSAPTPPEGLVVGRDGLKANVIWQDRSANEHGFRVYRREGGGPPQKIADLPAGTTGYTDRGLRPSTRYDYQIAAFNPFGESLGQPAGFETAAVESLTVDLSLLTKNPKTGEAVQFEAAFSGPVRQARWELGEGLAWSGSPCSLKAFCASHIFTKPGAYTVAVTLVGEAGQLSRTDKVIQVEGPPVELPGSEPFLPELVFSATGKDGDSGSSLWLHNAGRYPTLIRFDYQPRSASAEPATREVTVAPQTSLQLRNVLLEVFGRTNEEGTLTLSSHLPLQAGTASPRIFAFSRSTADLERPSFPRSSTESVIAGIFEEDKLTASLLAASLDDRAGQVTIELRDREGRLVGTPATVGLPPHGFKVLRVSRLFPEALAHTGPFSARLRSDGIRFASTATLLQSESTNRIAVPSTRTAEGRATANPSGEVFIPRLMRGSGRFGMRVQSGLVATNDSAEFQELTFELWLRGANNLAPLTTRRVIAPGTSMFLSDALADLFGLDEALGALRVTWPGSLTGGPPPRILSFTFSEARDGQGKRFGMLVDSLGLEDAVASRALDFGAEQSNLVRSSYGVINLATEPTTLQLTLRSSSGLPVGRTMLRLKPRQHLERGVMRLFPESGQSDNRFIETEVLSGGPILTYLLHLDSSGDLFLVPGRKD